jgi:hypothetical protein
MYMNMGKAIALYKLESLTKVLLAILSSTVLGNL